MIKSALIAAASSIAISPAVLAGPYVNVETNAGWLDKEFVAAVTDIHFGVEGENGAWNYYAQGGPAYVKVADVDGEVRLSGKAGGGYAVSESVGVYGELSALTGEDKEDFSTGGKLGLKYKF